jgi:ATP-dependent Clp protease ATP-binding subunit ClpA
MARLIQDTIRRALADELLFGKLKGGGIVKIDIDPADKDRLKFQYLPEQRGLLSFGKKPEKA